MNSKPTVQYQRLLHPAVVGESAYLVGLTGHPRQETGDLSGKGLVRTSTVQSIGENGEFETLNTVYKPE